MEISGIKKNFVFDLQMGNPQVLVGGGRLYLVYSGRVLKTIRGKDHTFLFPPLNNVNNSRIVVRSNEMQ